MNKSIFVATPMYGGWCSYVYVQSLFRTMIACAGRGIGITFQFLGNDSIITRARNILADGFLNPKDESSPKCTHLLWADADMDWRAEDVLKMIDADVPIIAALLPKKEINWQQVKNAAMKDTPVDQLKYAAKSIVIKRKELGKIENDKPLEVDYIGTALMLIKREVFEQLADKVADYVLDLNDVNNIIKHGDKVKEFYATGIDPDENIFMSEDFYFCKLWRNNGGKVYAAPWAITNHFGTHLF